MSHNHDNNSKAFQLYMGWEKNARKLYYKYKISQKMIKRLTWNNGL
jgi:hypothetical protein